MREKGAPSRGGRGTVNVSGTGRKPSGTKGKMASKKDFAGNDEGKGKVTKKKKEAQPKTKPASRPKAQNVSMPPMEVKAPDRLIEFDIATSKKGNKSGDTVIKWENSSPKVKKIFRDTLTEEELSKFKKGLRLRDVVDIKNLRKRLKGEETKNNSKRKKK